MHTPKGITLAGLLLTYFCLLVSLKVHCDRAEDVRVRDLSNVDDWLQYGDYPISQNHHYGKSLSKRQPVSGADQRNRKGEDKGEDDEEINVHKSRGTVPVIADQRNADSSAPGQAANDGFHMMARLRYGRDTVGSRRYKPRVQLAQRPKSTSTTTSTTVASSTVNEVTGTESTRDSEINNKDPSVLALSASDDSEYEATDEGESEVKPVSTSGRQKSSPAKAVGRKQAEASEQVNGRSSPSSSTQPVKLKPAPTTKKPSTTEPSVEEDDDDDEAEENNEDNGGGSEPATTKASPKVEKPASGKQLARKKKPLVALPFIKPKNESICTAEAYLEFPKDLVGNKWRGRGLVFIHIAVVCYMFYSLALVCERYFMPSLEEFAQRLQLSEDVAGATLMSAGSSAPELFTAILGVFVAKGDVGTGTIVGSAVFNILFVIGVCAFVCTTSAQLNWWPVLRDSVFYTFTVLVLILFIYDERVTAFESLFMIALYGLYILIMIHNDTIREHVTRNLQSHPLTAKLINSVTSVEGPDDVFGSVSGSSTDKSQQGRGILGSSGQQANYQTTSMVSGILKTIEDDSMFLAAMLVIVQHKRLFRSQLRFQSAARYIIVKRQHRMQQKSSKSMTKEVNYFGPESEQKQQRGYSSNQRDRMDAYAKTTSKSKFSLVSKDDYEFWNRPPEEGENYYVWLAKIPVNYVLHYTIPDCTLYPDKYLLTFIISILWTALFSYVMVWMITLIGYTFGIPDSVMGMTFLAAGTSVPDCYSSVHAARNGMADMAVSNSIGSNVFDILIGLSLPWFIQTAIYPGVVATINSRGVIYSVMLLFLSLVVTIYLMNQYEWTLKPRLGLALLIAYGLFIVLTCMLEFNLFGHVNPPPCPVK